jgi:hypothetical protein
MGGTETPDSRKPSAPASVGSARATLAALAAAPPVRALAAALVAAQGLLLVGLGVLQVVRGFGHEIDNLARAEFGGVLSLLCGLLVLALARRLVTDPTATKSPVIVIQLLCLPVGWALVDNGWLGYGIPLLAVAVAILALLAAAGLRGRGETAGG